MKDFDIAIFGPLSDALLDDTDVYVNFLLRSVFQTEGKLTAFRSHPAVRRIFSGLPLPGADISLLAVITLGFCLGRHYAEAERALERLEESVEPKAESSRFLPPYVPYEDCV